MIVLLFVFLFTACVVNAAYVDVPAHVFDITRDYTVEEVCDLALGIFDAIELAMWRAPDDAAIGVKLRRATIEARSPEVNSACMKYGEFTIFNMVSFHEEEGEKKMTFIERAIIRSDEKLRAHFSDSDGKLRIVFMSTRDPGAVAASLGRGFF